jgi:O-antigen/teichoic acid export membrane protein
LSRLHGAGPRHIRGGRRRPAGDRSRCVSRLDGASRGILLCGLIAALVGTNFSAAASSIARGSARPVLSELPHLVIALARLIALLALAVAGSRSLGSVALALGAAGVAGLIVSVASARSCVRASALPRERPTPGIRILVTASVPFVLQTVAAMMIARLDVVFLGLVSSPAAVGEYEATLRMTERLFQLVPFLLLAQYLPVATTLWQGGRVEEFERLYRGVTRLSYWVIVPIFITLAAFPEPLLRLVFGASFPVHPQVVWVLVAGLVPNAVLATTWMALAATGERRMLVQVSGLTLVVMVASAALFIPWLGMVGAAAATSVSMLTQQVAAAKALHRRTGIRPMHQKFLGLLAGSALLMLVAFAFRWRIVDGSIWSVALTSAAVLLAWLAWVWRTERPGMRWLFNMALAPQARRT